MSTPVAAPPTSAPRYPALAQASLAMDRQQRPREGDTIIPSAANRPASAAGPTTTSAPSKQPSAAAVSAAAAAASAVPRSMPAATATTSTSTTTKPATQAQPQAVSSLRDGLLATATTTVTARPSTASTTPSTSTAKPTAASTSAATATVPTTAPVKQQPTTIAKAPSTTATPVTVPVATPTKPTLTAKASATATIELPSLTDEQTEIWEDSALILMSLVPATAEQKLSAMFPLVASRIARPLRPFSFGRIDSLNPTHVLTHFSTAPPQDQTESDMEKTLVESTYLLAILLRTLGRLATALQEDAAKREAAGDDDDEDVVNNMHESTCEEVLMKHWHLAVQWMMCIHTADDSPAVLYPVTRDALKSKYLYDGLQLKPKDIAKMLIAIGEAPLFLKPSRTIDKYHNTDE